MILARIVSLHSGSGVIWQPYSFMLMQEAVVTVNWGAGTASWRDGNDRLDLARR